MRLLHSSHQGGQACGKGGKEKGSGYEEGRHNVKKKTKGGKKVELKVRWSLPAGEKVTRGGEQKGEGADFQLHREKAVKRDKSEGGGVGEKKKGWRRLEGRNILKRVKPSKNAEGGGAQRKWGGKKGGSKGSRLRGAKLQKRDRKIERKGRKLWG